MSRGQVLVSDSRETIFAPATAPGRAGVAVVRVSGPAARRCVEVLAGSCPRPRYMSLRRLRGEDGETIDQALVVYFEAGSSYTDEPMAEFHVHGGPSTVAAVLKGLSGISGSRMATPGEFTRRAMRNGKLDLAQAEGVADLIEAETESQRKQALALTEGRFSKKILSWRDRAIASLSLVEATIEFGDEDDVPGDAIGPAREEICRIINDLEKVIEASVFSKGVREGFEVALVGPPNVGKSSLINLLSEKESAIVSPIAGTTRDVLRISIDINGLFVTFLDMAGLRETADDVEKIGVERALASADAADIRIFMSSADTGRGHGFVGMRRDDIDVWSKCDQGPGPGDINLSALTGSGVTELMDLVSRRLSGRTVGGGFASHERQLEGLRQAAAEFHSAGAAMAEEICAAHMKYAIRSLEGIVDAVSVEDVLDEVFARFCIGK